MRQTRHSRAAVAILQLILLVISPLAAETRAQKQEGARLLTQPEVKTLPPKAKRWALIVGVNNYEKDISPLRGSVNDAKALTDVLIRNAGFPANQVILMTTDATDPDFRPTLGNILDALERLSRQIPEGGLLLFSFSGHGKSIDKDAFLIPADGRVYQNAELMRERSIDVLRVKRAIQLTKATQVLMFLDACRDEPVIAKGDGANPMTASYEGISAFDNRNKGIEAFATIFATSNGDRAYEFIDKATGQYRGFFSYAIEEALRGEAANENGEITLGSLINYLERKVSQRVYIEKNQRQVPYPMTEGYRNSELVLAVARNANISPGEKQAPDFGSATGLADKERKAFVGIQNSTVVSDIRAVLEEFPTSRYAADLRKRLERLVWDEAKASHDRARLQAYLDEFGEHAQYASLARAEITRMAPVNSAVAANKSAEASQPVLTPAALTQLALKELMDGNHEAAIKLTAAALKTNKTLPLALAISGNAKFDIYRKRKEGRLELERAVQLEPNNLFYVALLAKFNNDDYRKSTYSFDNSTAKRLAVEALALTPKTDIDYYARGISRSILASQTYDVGDEKEHLWAAAAAEFSTAIQLNPQFWIAYLERGVTYEHQLKYDEAIGDYTKLIEIKPNDVRGYFHRGFVYGNRREDYDSAIRDFDKAIEIVSDSPFIFAYRGASYLKKSEYDRAIADLTKAIQLFPMATTYRDRAKAYEAIGRKDLAEADKKKAEKARYP